MRWDGLIDEYRNRNGKIDMKAMKFTMPDKHNKVIERFAPKQQVSLTNLRQPSDASLVQYHTM